MEKHFVTYNQALALKELGYDEPCFGWYEHNGNFYYCYQEGLVPPSPSKKLIKGCCLAPLKSQVFEWFRKTYNIHNVPLGTVRNSDNKVVYHIGKPNTISLYTKLYDTYEEAESACIDKLIEIVKTK